MVVSIINYYHFYPENWGRLWLQFDLRIFFQMGFCWNHQPAIRVFFAADVGQPQPPGHRLRGRKQRNHRCWGFEASGFDAKKRVFFYPTGSMGLVYLTYIDPNDLPWKSNIYVGKYIMHGSYGIWSWEIHSEALDGVTFFFFFSKSNLSTLLFDDTLIKRWFLMEKIWKDHFWLEKMIADWVPSSPLSWPFSFLWVWIPMSSQASWLADLLERSLRLDQFCGESHGAAVWIEGNPSKIFKNYVVL